MLRCLLIVWTVSLSVAPVWGHRIFATVDPTPLEENLTFDTNDIPLQGILNPASSTADLNFSPNVVFTQDSNRAFVSYSGSNKVLAFDTRTGDVVKLIEVGENPALITLTPDGTKVAVVCLFLQDNLPDPASGFVGKLIGALSIIDVATLEVQTLDLERVLFSFANNVIFSSDSKTGFVASSGTDEILRFDVESATEFERLQVTQGSRPSSLTMAPDFSFFGLVLVGSTLLDIQQVPDSVQLVNTDTFSLLRSIVPEREELQAAHDFLANNTLAISQDGTRGIIADQENSLLGSFPDLVANHAILLDLETGETIEIFTVGGLAGASFLVPGRSLFVNVGARRITAIDFETLELVTVLPQNSEFNATSRVAFSQDGSRAFLASPTLNRLLEVDLDPNKNLAVRRSMDVGPNVVRESDGDEFTIPAAPLDVTLSPDGTVLSIVKFNANTIELLEDSGRFYIPRLLSTSEWFAGVAVTNNSSGDASIIATAFDPIGRPYQDNSATEEVVEYTNPNTIDLGPGQHTSFTAEDLLQPAPQTDEEGEELATLLEIDGWLDFDTDQSQTGALFLIGDRVSKRMDGGLSRLETSNLSILPEVPFDPTWKTELIVLNPNDNFTDAGFALFDHAGETIDSRSIRVPSNTSISLFLIDTNLDIGLFSEETFEDFPGGYMTVFSEHGIVAAERYYDEEKMAFLDSIPVPASQEDLPDTLYVPHVVLFQGAKTFLNLIYGGEEATTATLTLTGDQGVPLAPSVDREMEPGSSFRADVAELFDLVEQESALTGWILIESITPGIVGNVEIQLSDRAMTAFLAQDTPLGNFVFSHLVQGAGLSTGMVLVNPGTDPATVQIEVRASDGSLVDSLSPPLLLGPGERKVDLLKGLFPDLPDMGSGYIQVISDQDLISMELLFRDDLEYLAAVPPRPVDSQ